MHFRDNQLPYHYQVLELLRKDDFNKLEVFLASHPELITPEGLLQNPMLHLACRYNSHKMVKLIHQQLENNIKILAKHAVAEEGWTPLHLAAVYGDAELMQTLINILAEEAPAIINLTLKDNTKATALHLAMNEGKTAVVEILLKAVRGNNAFVEHLLADEWPLLHLAVYCGDIEMVTALLNVISPAQAKQMAKVYLKSGMNILHLAAISGEAAIAKQILRIADDLIYDLAQAKVGELDNATPLNLAIQYGLTEMVKHLLQALKELAKPSCTNYMASGWNAFLQVAYFGNVEMLQAMLQVLGKDAEKLIMQPFSLIKNTTPFHMVINRGNVAMTKVMLEAVDKKHHPTLLNLEQNDGIKPLHLAKRFYNDDLLNILLATSAKVA